MSTNYVNKIRKDGVEYDINDTRLNDELVEKLSDLLSNVSIDEDNYVHIQGLITSSLEVDDTLYIDGGLTQLQDENGEFLFPLENNAGKVLMVNEDETGFEAKEVSGGTQLYKNSLHIGSGNEIIYVDNKNEDVDMYGVTSRLLNALFCKLSLTGSFYYIINVTFTGNGFTVYYLKNDGTIGTLSVTEISSQIHTAY